MQIIPKKPLQYVVDVDKQHTLEQVTKDIKKMLTNESGHDWWHVHRVLNLSKQLAQHEGGDLFIIELAALLHDVADHKFHDGDYEIGTQVACEIMFKYDIEQEVIDHVADIVTTISFKGVGVSTPMKTVEGQIVQDADRLDALGAIGIGRTFAYSGYKQRPMYIPGEQYQMHDNKEAYAASQGSTVAHFHEKLLLLKERMNTQTAKQIAQKRHDVMVQFLEQFMCEWDCRDL